MNQAIYKCKEQQWEQKWHPSMLIQCLHAPNGNSTNIPIFKKNFSIFMLYRQYLNSLDTQKRYLEFINNANHLHLTIKFTYLFSPETVNFQDTTVHLINIHIET